MVRVVSTVRRKKQVPEEKSVCVLLLRTETYLCCCKSQPNILPLTPSLGTNKNKHLPCGVQNKDVVLGRRIGGGGNMRELGHISLVSVHNTQHLPVGSAKRRFSKYVGRPRRHQPSISSKMRWRIPCHRRRGLPKTSRLRRSCPRQGRLRSRHHHRGYWRIQKRLPFLQVLRLVHSTRRKPELCSNNSSNS